MTKAGRGKHGLNREMLRMGLSGLVTRTQQKAERKGGQVLFVNPAYTSQTCSTCGSINKESRKSQARYQCVDCGFRFNADKNAALNILAKANV
jgi:putative transposase